MKSTGITRNIDELGRIVLPITIRQHLGLEKHDPVEIFMEGDLIILQKYQPTCIFCDNDSEITFYNGKRICARCLDNIKRQF